MDAPLVDRGAGGREAPEAGPVVGGGGQGSARQRDPVTVDPDDGVVGAAEVGPELGQVLGEGATGGALADPVEHLGVGGAVGPPRPRGDPGADPAEQGARVTSLGEAAEQRRGRASPGRGGPRPSRPRSSWSARRRTRVPPYPVPRSSGTCAQTSSPSASSPAATARPTRWASADFVIDAPRKTRPGSEAGRVPLVDDGAPVERRAARSCSSPRSTPRGSTSVPAAGDLGPRSERAGAVGSGSGRARPGRPRWRQAGSSCGSVNRRRESREPGGEAGTRALSRSGGCCSAACGCTPHAGCP